MAQLDDEVNDVIIALDGFKNWIEESGSTGEQPTWVRIGPMGVVGRVTYLIKHPYEGQWYYAFYFPGIGGGSGHEASLNAARIKVEKGIKSW